MNTVSGSFCAGCAERGTPLRMAELLGAMASLQKPLPVDVVL